MSSSDYNTPPMTESVSTILQNLFSSDLSFTDSPYLQKQYCFGFRIYIVCLFSINPSFLFSFNLFIPFYLSPSDSFIVFWFLCVSVFLCGELIIATGDALPIIKVRYSDLRTSLFELNLV